MDKKTKKILIIAGVGLVVVYLIMQRQQTQQQMQGYNPYADLANAIGGAFMSLGNATNSIINTAGQNKRENRQQGYNFLRETKDNDLLYSNDVLIL